MEPRFIKTDELRPGDRIAFSGAFLDSGGYHLCMAIIDDEAEEYETYAGIATLLYKCSMLTGATGPMTNPYKNAPNDRVPDNSILLISNAMVILLERR